MNKRYKVGKHKLHDEFGREIASNSALRPLSDNEKIAIEFIRQTPRCTVEDVLNFMVPFDHADEIRSEIASAVGYLISNGYVEKNKANSALVISETPPK